MAKEKESKVKPTKEKTETIDTKQEEPKEEKTVEETIKVEKQNEKSDRKKSVKIDMNELIEVRSVVKGGLTYISTKTGLKVRWAQFGAVEFIEFGELLTMKASSPKFLNDPLLIIEDEDAVEKLGLSKMYESLWMLDNLDGFFEQSIETMKEAIDKAPKGLKKLFADKTKELVLDEKLFDMRKIKFLEEKLDIDLQLIK